MTQPHPPLPTRGSPSWARRLWLAVAVAAAVVAALVVRGLDHDDDLVADSPQARAPIDPARLADPERWITHRDPDRAQAVAPAADGGVWVATAGGLLRWDAHGEDYQRFGARQLAGRDVDALAAAGGDVWVATSPASQRQPSDAGPALLRFDGRRWSEHPIDTGPLFNDVDQLAVDAAGTVWATTSYGLARFRAGQWHTHRPFREQTDAARVSPEPATMIPDAHGAVWATVDLRGDSHAVARFADGAWRVWTSDDELPAGTVERLAVGGGAVWLALGPSSPDAREPDGPASREPPPAGRSRLARWDGRRWAVVDAAGVPRGRLDELVVDGDGRPWILTQPRFVPGHPPPIHRPDRPTGSRVSRLVGGRWRRVVTDALPTTRLGGLRVLGDGTAVVTLRAAEPGYTGPWVASFDGTEWTTYPASERLPHPRGVRLAPAAAPLGPVPPVGPAPPGPSTTPGSVWAASGNGVVRFDGRGWTRFATGGGVASGRANDVVVGHGATWVATDQGVSRWDGDSWTTWTAADGLAATEVLALALGPHGSVWAGTDAGVSRLDGPDAPEGPGGAESATRQGRQGWTTWSDELDARAAISIDVSDDGVVWAITAAAPGMHPGRLIAERGVARFADRQWTRWPGDDLPVAAAPTRIAAGDDHAWVAFRPGDRMSPFGPGAPSEPSEASDAPDDAHRGGVARFDGRAWHVHTAADGLPDGEVGALTVQRDGTVWVGTVEGIARFQGARWATGDTGGNPLGLGDDDPVATDEVSSIATGPGDAVWAATVGELWRWHDGEWTSAAPEALPRGAASALAVGRDSLWVATSRGLLSFTRGAGDTPGS